MHKLETKNIFIDTSVFISNSYGANDKIRQIAKYGSEGKLKIWYSDIVINELKSNIMTDLNTAKNLVNEWMKKLNQTRILKHVDEYKAYFELSPIKNFSLDFDSISTNIDSFIHDSKAQRIPHDLASINDIIHSYFGNEFPFNKGKKKHEFPDAIMLSSIENWCKINKSKMHISSIDNDMLEYQSEFIIPIKDLNKILDILNREASEHQNLLKKIDSMYLDFSSDLINEIKSSFYDKYESSQFDLEINDLEIDSISLGQFDITFMNNREAILEVNSYLQFGLTVVYNDYSSAIHDNEDDIWYNINSISQKIKKSVNLPVTINVDFNPPAGSEFSTIKITDIGFPNDLIIEELEDGFFHG